MDAYLSPTTSSIPSYPAPTPPSITGDLTFRRDAARIERAMTELTNKGEGELPKAGSGFSPKQWATTHTQRTHTKHTNTNETADLAPTWLKPIIAAAGPIIVKLMVLIRSLYPYILKAHSGYLWAHANLPMELLVALWGLTLCFFGGTFSLTLAAYEAFKISGWDVSRAALTDLYEEMDRYLRASVEDDKRDDDGDGIADVEQIDSKELVKRKLALVLKVADPNKVNDALGGISQGLVGVVATLKFKHARTVALGVSIGNHLRRPAGLYLTPILAGLVPKEHRKWVPHIINYLCKAVAVSVAWTVSAVVSAVQCGVRGGLMFARSMLKYANKRGWCDIDEEETYLDEAVGWFVAVLGAGFQIWNGFGLPFPLNLILIPVRVLEGYLRWVVTE